MFFALIKSRTFCTSVLGELLDGALGRAVVVMKVSLMGLG
jgi:hypothetical protein